MAAKAQGPVDDQAVDGGDVIGLEAQAVIAKRLDFHVFHGNGTELGKAPARRLHARRNVFEPRLVRRDLDGLGRLLDGRRFQDALPALPRKFVIVPGAHERPARAGILQVRIGKKALPHCAVTLERRRKMVVADLERVGDPRDLVDFPVEARLPFLWVLHDLVDEIAKVQDEIELVLGARPLVFKDQPAIAVEPAFVDVLATDEGEIDWPGIIISWSGNRAPDPASISLRICEAVPIRASRHQSADEHARRPVGCG